VAARLLDALVAFAAVGAFLILRKAWRRRSRSADALPDLRPVADRIKEIRTDYPAALRVLPHPTAHDEIRLQDARAKAAMQPFFHREAEAQAPEKDDENATWGPRSFGRTEFSVRCLM